jgi:ABC-type phosphate transport system substrate-binding protein
MGLRGRISCIMCIMCLTLGMERSQVIYARDLPDRRSRPEQALAIVVNKANPVENLSSVELRKIFMGTRGHWPNGRRITVAMLDYGQPERKAILRQVYRMDEDAYHEHFLKEIYRGDVFATPKTLSSPVVMRKFVFNAPGAIGYLRASDVDDSVKVLRIDGHLPDDQDYNLLIDEPL